MSWVHYKWQNLLLKKKNMKHTKMNKNNINTLNINNSKNIMPLPVNINSIVIGIMLGDGGLYRSSPTANTRLEMSFVRSKKNIKIFLKV
jgi:hypothetical protein